MKKRMKNRKNTVKIKRARSENDEVVVCSLTDVIHLRVGDILYLEANGYSTTIHYGPSDFIVSTHNLKYWEARLPHFFWRVHHHWFINSKKITRFLYRQYKVNIQGKLIDIARRRLSTYLAIYKKSGIR